MRVDPQHSSTHKRSVLVQRRLFVIQLGALSSLHELPNRHPLMPRPVVLRDVIYEVHALCYVVRYCRYT
jgi:hypothetical protein